MNAAVFLDKDGTLVEDVPYNVDPAAVRLSEGAGPALARLVRQGFRLVLVSNQSGVARGYFEEPVLEAVTERIQALLRPHDVALDAAYYCPHHPEGRVAPFAIGCDCRKPGDGMLRRAAADLGISLEQSWMVGDILHDVEAGRRAGCRTVLLDVGHESEWLLTPGRMPHYRARDLHAAADVILRAGPIRPSRAASVEVAR
ncbi:MAG: HAD family hydrolase [Dehalococcoidia bacterium]|nr:HAD family hydrolase [Dehalococcoidia bacterium]